MSSYYCFHCGGRTGMMGHGDRHNPDLLNLAARVCDDLEVSRTNPRFSQIRRKVVDAIGQWQIAEINIPGGSDWMRSRRQCPHGEPLSNCADCVREHNEATR